MAVSGNSASSRRSKFSAGKLELLLCAAALIVLSAAAIVFVQWEGTALFYGDAAAHLNIARRIVDGRHPGYEQIGTVWLPLPHVLMLPLVTIDSWWRNGLAGAIPAGMAWVLAGTFLFATLRRFFDRAASLAGTALFALQPNLLYLQATPMTESIFFAAALGLLYFTVRLAESQSPSHAALAGLCGCAASLTRYEGWALLPLAGLYILYAAGERRWACAFAFTAVAAMGPLFWFAHNQIFYSDWLEFYRGEGSAKDIQKGRDYPGAHDWSAAALQYFYAMRSVLGWPALVFGLLGLLPLLQRRYFWPILFGLASPFFYIMNLQSGDLPIYVPDVHPFTHYNSRYALAPLPLIAFATAALAAWLPRGKWLLPLLALSWFTFVPLTVKNEGEANSRGRRAYTEAASRLLNEQYQRGSGLWMPFGDLTGILQKTGIPLRETIHTGDQLEFNRYAARPDLFLDTAWVISLEGDRASRAMTRATAAGLPYRCVKLKTFPFTQDLEVWRRFGP